MPHVGHVVASLRSPEALKGLPNLEVGDLNV